MTVSRRFRTGRLAVLVAALLAACAKRAEPPTADSPPALPPSLAGRTVMILPAQPAPGAAVAPGAEAVPGFDAALQAALTAQAPRVRWVPVAAVERAARRSPTLRIRPRELAVADFHRMRMLRIGEPLFSDLHALGLLLDARYALLPYAVQYVTAADSAGRVEVGATLIDNSDGDVLWIGVVAGDRGAPEDTGTVASAARALAQPIGR